MDDDRSDCLRLCRGWVKRDDRTAAPALAMAREIYGGARNLRLDDADFAAVVEALRPPSAYSEEP